MRASAICRASLPVRCSGRSGRVVPAAAFTPGSDRRTAPSRSQVGELGLEAVAGPDRHQPVQRPGEHDVAAAQPATEPSRACSPARRRSVPGCRARPRRRRCRSATRCGGAAPRPGAGRPRSTGVIRPPRTTFPAEALSATVSATCTRQSAIRLSTTSIAGSTPATAVSASAMVTPGPARSVAMHEGHLGLDPRLDEQLERDLVALVEEHVVEQDAEVGLGDAEDSLLRAPRGPAQAASADHRARRRPGAGRCAPGSRRRRRTVRPGRAR